MRPEWPIDLEESLTTFVLDAVARGMNERQAVLQFVLEGHTKKSFPAVYKRWRTKLRGALVTVPGEKPVEIHDAVEVIQTLYDRIRILETEIENLRALRSSAG